MHRKVKQSLFVAAGALLIAAALARGQETASQTGAPATIETLKPETEQLLKTGEQELTTKHYDDAVKSFKKASKAENDKCSRCYLKLAEAQIRLGDEKEALSSCDKAVAAATDDAARAAGHSAKGDVLVATKKLKEAEAEYQSAIQLDPTFAEYHLRLAIALLKESRDAEGKEQLSAYLKLAPTGIYASYAKRLEVNPRRAREDYAPEFQVTTIKGQSISSSDFLGKVVVMDFWATWCPPCRASVGEIKELTKKYPRDKVVVLSVSADKDDAKWREFVEKKNMDWLQYRDADDHVLKLMNIHAFPTYIVIDSEGIIRDRIVGENPQQTIVGRLKDKLQKMMPQG
jgi:peroxiredoxin/Flp pilus assembly protein TadD